MDATFIQARIDAAKAQIIAYEAACLALATGGIQSYSLDTGQTKQNVTKLDLDKLRSTLNSLYNSCATLEARLNGSGVIISRPAW